MRGQSLRISDLHKSRDLVVSFELFPPRTPEAEAKLFDQAIPDMLKLEPAFFTCTYGAGGSTHDKTLEIVTRVKKTFNIDAASHLTCVGASRDELCKFLDQAKEAGVTNILALRGDPPEGDASFEPHPDGFEYAIDLIRLIESRGGFDITVAGYPQGHPECSDKYLDWDRCAAKVEAGADMIVTQLFFDNEDFFAFKDYLVNKLGVTVPIVPGVLPILSAKQIRRFCSICGAVLPDRVEKRLNELQDDNAACRQYGIDLATEMCDELIRQGVPGFHFYTLNRAASTAAVMRNLGLNTTA